MTWAEETTFLLLRAVAVLATQIFLFLFLPMFACRHLPRSVDSALSSMIFSATVLTVLGLVLDWLATHPQRLVAPLYLCVWGAVAVAVRMRSVVRRAEGKQDRLLPLLLVLAVIVRWIHPLSTWALGQSDAYAHLSFARDVVEGGRLSNPIYPPGYAWIMALPTLVFGIDPYWVARFGGAFWGAGLTLGLYSLVRSIVGLVGARIAAGLVAGCPLAWWLIKTGVGSFPNQLGLFLLPVLVKSLIQAWRGDADKSNGLLFGSAMIVQALTVPMMFMQTVLLIAFLGSLVALRNRRTWQATLISFLLAVPGAALFALHLMNAGGAARSQTPAHLSGGEVVEVINREEAPAELDLTFSQLWHLAVDFIRLKRWISDQWPLTFAMGAVALSFLGVLGWKWRSGAISWIALGGWGALTAIQTASGMFQFTNYQRQGWSLIIAMIAFAGLFTGTLSEQASVRAKRWLQSSYLALFLAILGLFIPPAHSAFGSPAENELIAFLRALQGDPIARKKWPDLHAFWMEADHLSTINVISRPISGFSNQVGDPIYAFSTRRIRNARDLIPPEAGEISILILDADEEQPFSVPKIMAWLQPSLTYRFADQRQKASETNAQLERRLRMLELPTKDLALSPGLRAIVIYRAEANP